MDNVENYRIDVENYRIDIVSLIRTNHVVYFVHSRSNIYAHIFIEITKIKGKQTFSYYFIITLFNSFP